MQGVGDGPIRQPMAPNWHLRSITPYHVTTYRISTNIRQQFFNVRVASIWNTLSQDVSFADFSSFKSINQSINQSIIAFVAPSGAQAANMTPPGTPVQSQSLQPSPGVSSFFDVCFQIAALCVSRSSSFPFPLWIPG